MEANFFFIIIAGILILACVGGYINWLREKRRREALMALARELGMSFNPLKDRSHDNEYAHFEIFRRGHSRAAYNTLTGTVAIKGRPYAAKMGDFKYKITTSNGKTTSTRTYRFSYLIVHLPFVGVPDLLIRREGMFDKLKSFLGFGALSFESEEFSRRFHVQCADRKFAYDVIEPRMMEFLMQSNPMTIDIEHGRMCLSDGSRRWDAEQFKQQLNWMQEFFERWPKHVKVDLDHQTAI